jgi:SAM-dependent methyltransferase
VAERTGGLRALLSVPRLYSSVQEAVGAGRSRRLLAQRHIRAAPGARVLDVGCGPGELIGSLPSVDYLGFDLNPRYIEAAKRDYGDRGRFFCADARDVDLSAEEPFDVVLAVGLLHHLDDAGVNRLLRLAASVLADEGRLVTFDGVLVPGQPRLARWLIERDRGREVRTFEGYLRLARAHFERVDHTVSEDFLRVPYTHLVMEVSLPRKRPSGASAQAASAGATRAARAETE